MEIIKQFGCYHPLYMDFEWMSFNKAQCTSSKYKSIADPINAIPTHKNAYLSYSSPIYDECQTQSTTVPADVFGYRFD